jgi:hypothetical protein
MIRRPRTSTIPHTPNLPHPPRKRRHDFLGPINSDLLTRAHRRNRGRGIPAEPARAGAAAHHLARAGALVRRARPRAVGLPAAVAATAALGLAAAFDGGWVRGAGSRDGGAAGGFAGGVGDADAGDVGGAVAGFVGGGVDGCEEGEEGYETHDGWW